MDEEEVRRLFLSFVAFCNRNGEALHRAQRFDEWKRVESITDSPAVNKLGIIVRNGGVFITERMSDTRRFELKLINRFEDKTPDWGGDRELYDLMKRRYELGGLLTETRKAMENIIRAYETTGKIPRQRPEEF